MAKTRLVCFYVHFGKKLLIEKEHALKRGEDFDDIMRQRNVGWIGNCSMKAIENMHQISHTLKVKSVLKKKNLENMGLYLQVLLVHFNKIWTLLKYRILVHYK